MTDKQRQLISIDIMKVVMMLLVVAYHVCCAWNQNWSPVPLFHGNEQFSGIVRHIAYWLNTVHVPAFVFASGYLFYHLRYQKGKYRKGRMDIKNRARRLLLPYCVICMFWCVPVYWLVFDTSVQEVIKKFIFAVSPAQLWFLWMLFWVYLVFYLVSDYLEKLPVWTVTIVLLVVNYMGSSLTRITGAFNFFQLANSLKYLLFFYLGGEASKNESFIIRPLYAVTCIIVGLCSAILLCRQDSKALETLFLPITSCFSVVGWYSALLSCATKKILGTALFRILKSYSMPIFLLHQQLLYFWIFALFNREIPSLVLWILFFVLTIVSSILTASSISFIPGGKEIIGYEDYGKNV